MSAHGQTPALLLLVPLAVERAVVLGATGDAVVRRVGMGPRRAVAAAREAHGAAAGAVAVIGFCGALTDDLRPGDVVVADSVGVDGGGRLALEGGPLVAALRAAGVWRVRRGPIVSSPRIARGPARARLARQGAVAVDMESAWLARGAGGRPFVVLRVVADTPATSAARPVAAMRGFLAAARSLRRAAPAVAQWAGATGRRDG